MCVQKQINVLFLLEMQDYIAVHYRVFSLTCGTVKMLLGMWCGGDN